MHTCSVKGHLTSLQLTNPINQAAEWEQAALESFRQGAREATTVVEIAPECVK
jgi:hypothetical protein